MYLKFCVSSIFNWIHGKFLFYNVKLSIAQFTKSIYDKFSISLLQFFEFKYKTKKFFWNEFALHFQLLWKLLFSYQRFIWFLKILLPFEKILSCLLSLFYIFLKIFYLIVSFFYYFPLSLAQQLSNLILLYTLNMQQHSSTGSSLIKTEASSFPILCSFPKCWKIQAFEAQDITLNSFFFSLKTFQNYCLKYQKCFQV